MDQHTQPGTLRDSLDYEPRPLKFGTSGRRGDVADLTQLEIYIDARAELDYLLSLPRERGGIAPGEDFYFACDLRPSSSRFDPQLGGRGEMAQAVVQAITDAGLRPANLGRIPTPALTAYALARHRGSIMVTGSHIPFERNGYKTNTSRGELLKEEEAPIERHVARVRAALYAQPAADSLFNPHGLFKDGSRPLPPETDAARREYIARYVDFFPADVLRGRRLLVYQHSAVGRDVLVEILAGLGAELIVTGRSETFVPIDTENIDDALLARVQDMVDQATRSGPPLDAVISTDGDSDRPLILGVDPLPGGGCRARFFGGDVVGMVVAGYLGADAVVVPVSCNDAIDRSCLRAVLEPKTRIGSPFVVAGMRKACAKGKARVCGWEANGGFLTGSDVRLDGRSLAALPTRDAMLPILAVLSAAARRGCPVSTLFDELPKRFSKAALIKNFPRPSSQRIVASLTPATPAAREIEFGARGPIALDEEGRALELPAGDALQLAAIGATLQAVFARALGFGELARVNYTDGVRASFSNGDVAHVRPSGNADELRIYAVADTQERASQIAALGVAEPAGLLRQLEDRAK